MKNLTTITFLLFALFSINAHAQNKLKRYQVKSGMIEYETTTLYQTDESMLRVYVN